MEGNTPTSAGIRSNESLLRDSPEPSTSCSDQTPQASDHFSFPSIAVCGVKRGADEDDVDEPCTPKQMRTMTPAGPEASPAPSVTDCEFGTLSREAEVFALQAIHTALLKKLSEVGPILAETLKENKMYKSVLCDMGHGREELQRTLEVQCIRHVKQNPEEQVSDAQAMIIAATAVGKNGASPVNAMDDLLKLYKHCEPAKAAAACASY